MASAISGFSQRFLKRDHIIKPNSKDDAVSAILVLATNLQVENIWVRPLDGCLFEVLSIPFWAYNLSRGDVVECHPDADGLGLFLEKVVKKSRNRTVRIVFMAPEKLNHPAAVKLLEYLHEHRLLYEIFKPRMLSVNLPSDAEYEALMQLLECMPKDAQVLAEDGSPNPRKNLDCSDRKQM